MHGLARDMTSPENDLASFKGNPARRQNPDRTASKVNRPGQSGVSQGSSWWESRHLNKHVVRNQYMGGCRRAGSNIHQTATNA